MLKRILIGLSLVLGFLIASNQSFAFDSELPSIAFVQLPPEAQQMMRLIERGGPYPNTRDGIVFGNYQKLLPQQRRGYYHEFTVATPGARNRGARRIVTGGTGNPPQEYFYSDDHYASFKRIVN